MPRAFRCKYIFRRPEKREQNDSGSGKRNLLGAELGLLSSKQREDWGGREDTHGNTLPVW